MSKKVFKSQASSSKAVSGAFGGAQNGAGFGPSISSFGGVAVSPLSYIYTPPDLSGISDPNVVVALKNLQKKDGTTKSKALEDLQAYVVSVVENKGALEESILEAWIKIYPRTSIDSSRRVRQMAHTLQGQISASCGKRMARHMPGVVGSWLAGIYDNDKSVSRAAQDSFKQAFPTKEKFRNIWRAYPSVVVAYAKDVVLKETMYTLSDERTTSPDHASAKYSRTVGAVITMVTNLLDKIPQIELEKTQPALNALLNEERLWKLAAHEDAFVRRAIYRLLINVLITSSVTLDPSIISARVLTAGLHCSQMGSAYDYAKAIALLSAKQPTVWTENYAGSGKKSAKSRLCRFLRKGSQGGPADFWSCISDLLPFLPEDILRDEPDTDSSEKSDESRRVYSQLLEAIHEGVVIKDEPRINSSASWSTYITAARLICSGLHGPGDRHSFLMSSVLPLVDQYLKPSLDQTRWHVTGPQRRDIITKASSLLFHEDSNLFMEEMRVFSARFVADLKTSLPEQSKDYLKSQDSVSTEASRWYDLQAALLEESGIDGTRQVFTETITSEIKSAVSTLNARNGKPYGAAAALETSMRALPKLVLTYSEIKNMITGFADNDIPNLILSPSAKYLVSILNILDNTQDSHVDYTRCARELYEAPNSPLKSTALQALLSSSGLAHTPALADATRKILRHAIEQDDVASWDSVLASVSNFHAPRDLLDSIFSRMTESLSVDTERCAVLHGLELISKRNLKVLREFTTSNVGSKLLSSLLFLSEAEDGDVSQQAKVLNNALEGALRSSGDANQAIESMLAIIRNGLDEAGESSLSIGVLVNQAQKVLHQAGSAATPSTIAGLLPSPSQWTRALTPFLLQAPNPSIAITTSFGGALEFVSKSTPAQAVPLDKEGFSSVFRMVQYATKLIQATDIFAKATEEQKVILIRNLSLFLQLAGDNLSVLGSMPVWSVSEPDLESDIVDFIAEAQSLWASWLQETHYPELITNVQGQLLKDSSGLSAVAYYCGRACSAMKAEDIELHGHAPHHEILALKSLQKSPDIFMSMAVLTSIMEGKETMRLCNELIADLTGHAFNKDPSTGQHKLLLLNAILQRLDDLLDEIPQQRLIFFVKHIISELAQATIPIQTEMMKLLHFFLSPVKDIYGSFWADLFVLLQQIWTAPINDEALPSLHSSLRLLSLLRKQHMQEGNDDLLDTWTENKGPVAKGLVALMGKAQALPDESHQPRRIVNELLGRQLKGLTEDATADEGVLYPGLASESAALQQASYELLHEYIPSKQEELSLEKALNKDYIGTLPEELLSLILAAPAMNVIAGSDFHRSMPSSLRSYLLSWKLIFDHWTNASYALQADYATSLKEGTYIQDLLDLTFKILISSRAKPVDASKFSIESYIPNTEAPEKETQWLLIHLYYLTLRHLPTLAKTWWRDCTSRQTNIAVEAWTTKYISPLINELELSTIKEWAPSQATADAPLTVKVSFGTREITASIPVDEQTMSIAIRLPPSYPLSRAEVEGIHRVGVPENKWASWIRNAQGQITTTTTTAGEGNALIDCLLAWRKNVTAAMKGQTECAICYSVVAADRSLPSKKCPTCKNNFHAACLFRWFKSSNSSSCPLCRNTFAYS